MINVREILTILICLIFTVTKAQLKKIRVLDANNQKKIAKILCVNKTQNIIFKSDDQGYIHLKECKEQDILVFKHEKYFTSIKFCKNLEKNIYLEPLQQNLKSVVFSISKSAEKRKRVSEKIEIVLKKDIQRIAPQTSADLLSNVNGVRVQKSQLGGGSPVIRGLESNRVLLVVDGVRMNNAIYRSGHLQNSITVNPLQLQRAEVIFGPTSVVYGSDALGGVVHYYTRQLKLSNKPIFRNEAYTRLSSVNEEKTISFSNSISQKKWASFTNVTFSDFGDLKIGRNRVHNLDSWGLVNEYSNNSEDHYQESPVKNNKPYVQKKTGYHQLDVLQKMLFPINDRLDMTFNIQYSNSSNIPNFGKLNDLSNDELKFARWDYGPQRRWFVSSQLKLKDFNKWLRNGKITLAYQDISESRIQRKFGSLDRISRFENVNVLSLNGDFSVPLTTDRDRILYYGTELTHNTVKSKSRGETLSIDENRILGVQENFDVLTRYPNDKATYSNIAVYASYRQKIDIDKVFNSGIRFTHTSLNAAWKNFVLPVQNFNVQNNALTASLGYIQKIGNYQKIKGSLSSGFRSPNIDDIGKFREKSNKLTILNVDLKPEYLYSGELTYKLLAKDKLSFLEANVFYTLIQDYIYRQPFSALGDNINFNGDNFTTDDILANVNSGEAQIYGGTIAVNIYPTKSLKINVNATYTKGEHLTLKEPLSSIPPLFGNVQVSYCSKKYELALDYRFSLAKKLRDYNITEGIDNLDETFNNSGTPEWAIVNFNSRYSFSKNFWLRLQVQNIFDIHYKEFASSIGAPGRNLAVSAFYAF